MILFGDHEVVTNPDFDLEAVVEDNMYLGIGYLGHLDGKIAHTVESPARQHPR